MEGLFRGFLDRIKSFFKRPKPKAKAKQRKPVIKAVAKKTPEAAEKKAGKSSYMKRLKYLRIVP